MPNKTPDFKPIWLAKKKELTQAQSGKIGYGRRWQKARLVFLAKHPLCKACALAEKVTAACVVDHVRPHNDRYGLFWDENNWQALCFPCHSEKTVKRDGGFGRKKVRSNDDGN